MKFRNILAPVAVTGLGLLSSTAFAADLSSLTSSVNLDSVSTGVLAVAAVIVGVLGAVMGARMIISFMKGV